MSWITAAGSVLGSIGGSILSGRSNEKAADKNAAIQRELAQNGLSWRVADARKAGINPLAALGASLPSGSPVAVGTDYGDLGLGRAGQDISRAMTSKMTPEQRDMHNLNKRLLEVQIEGQELENKSKMVGTGPPLPTAEGDFAGSGSPLGVDITPVQVNASRQMGVEAGIKPMYQHVIDDEGYLRTMPTSNLADVMESHTPSYIYEMQKNLRMLANSYDASIGAQKKRELAKREYASYLSAIRPKSDRPGYEYRFDLKRQAWKLSKINGTSYLYTEPMDNTSGVKYKIRRD